MASAPWESLRPEETFLREHTRSQTGIRMGITGLGYLALTWSTVVLLGGFVATLGKKDFWCLTIISMLQASRIFNNLEHQLVVGFVQLCRNIRDSGKKNISSILARKIDNFASLVVSWIGILRGLIIWIIFVPPSLGIGFIYTYGPIACVVLSTWRIVQRDYGLTDGDDTKANLMPALDLFYSLVLCQGLLLVTWMRQNSRRASIVSSLRRKCKFPEKWGSVSVAQYLADTRAKCWQDPASIKGRNLINYAVDLLDSESQQDYISGARMLDVFIKQGVDVRSLILPSRAKVQKLIDTLRWRSSDREIRESAARIVAYLASDIDLTQFPGAIRCISSLLDTTLPYWNYQQGANHQSPQCKLEEPTGRGELIFCVKRLEQTRAKLLNLEDGDQQGNGWNELILQGLTILERLASDQYNCMDICSIPGLLPKIMAPLYSKTLIQDINISDAWADVVNGSLKVVHRLMHAPEWTGRRLPHEISSSEQAVSNLERILDQGTGASQELQMRAIEILTELALDLPTNLTEETQEKLIRKQLQLFLTVDQGGEEMLKVTAGKTLALLSKMGTISLFTKREHIDILYRLSAKVDFRNRTTYRTIAAKILENLCTHYHNTMDREHVKITLLPMVLGQVVTSEREPPTEASQSNIPEPGENQELPAPGNDEEKQLPRHDSQNNSPDQANEEKTARLELQEALLSLTFVMCDKLISAKDFDEVVQMIAPGEGKFVAKLKAIVEENCEAAAGSLRIVKLCSQIAVLMMRRNQDTAHFKDQKFVESLSKASEIMSNLESCMLFAGTDCGVNKTVRPLLSDLVEEAHALVG